VQQSNGSESGPVEEGGEVRRVEVRGTEGPTYSYNFKGLQTNRSFSLRVRSRNELGWGPFSSPFTFHMFQRGKPEKYIFTFPMVLAILKLQLEML
jgi:hypothetical protein